MRMSYEERLYARLVFAEKFSNLYGNAFEDFFHALMQLHHPDFVPVRTAGQLGDRGADGLSLIGEKLYACYAPETYDVTKVENKFNGDLEKARTKRDGEFEVFVFTHNEVRGIHPQVSSLIVEASKTNTFKLEQFGKPHFWRAISRLEKEDAEDLLSCSIPIQEKVYGIGLDDLIPLLEHLQRERSTAADPGMSLPVVPPEKMEYNSLTGETRERLIRGMEYTHLVEAYYGGTFDITSRDEAAEGFSQYYSHLKEEESDAEEIYYELLKYVLGNELPKPSKAWAAEVILSYFFQYCDIFERPPAGWTSGGVQGSGNVATH